MRIHGTLRRSWRTEPISRRTQRHRRNRRCRIGVTKILVIGFNKWRGSKTRFHLVVANNPLRTSSAAAAPDWRLNIFFRLGMLDRRRESGRLVWNIVVSRASPSTISTRRLGSRLLSRTWSTTRWRRRRRFSCLGIVFSGEGRFDATNCHNFIGSAWNGDLEVLVVTADDPEQAHVR